MRFLGECLKRVGLDFDSVLSGWSYSVYSDGVVMIEGQRGLLSIGSDAVAVKVGSGALEVCGEELKVDMLADGIVAVKGKKLAVRLVGENQ